MSTNTQTSTGEGGIIERNRERLFWLTLVLGMAIFALGMAFTILFLAMNTSPPAPYFASAEDRYLTGGLSFLFMIAGLLTLRMGAKVGGW
ncbi:MAG: hypothetical protein V5A38_04340 [Halolamina sp.]|uniref:hypothetical protein n=1 Tax=Halolamina sp. TaxID=1940283 RepID=UPI002FC30309